MRHWVYVSLGLVLFHPSLSRAQGPPPTSGRLAGITVQGLKRFTQEQVVAATGLHIGKPTDVRDLEQSAKYLAHSGAFESVMYRYRVHDEEMFVEFVVEESAHFLSCLFDNFVWLNKEEIDNALRSEVPFYDGSTPESGETVDRITVVLRELLVSRGVHCDVEHLLFLDFGTGKRAIQFRAAGLLLSIRALGFPGAIAVDETTLQAAAKQLIGQDYSESSAAAFARTGLLPLYIRRGHLRARFLEPHAVLLAGGQQGNTGRVTVSLPVEEGPSFLWDGADWNGDHALPPGELDARFGMKAGEVANGEKIDAGFEAIRVAYGARGYIQLVLRKEQIFDDAAQRVRYKVAIEEGPQYRMGMLTLTGISARAQDRLRSTWKLKPGGILDVSYVTEFLRKTAPQILANESPTCAQIQIKYAPDPQKAIANVELACR